MAPATKRSAQTTAAAAKRAKTVSADPTTRLCADIAKALDSAVQLPVASRHMLAQMVPGSIAVPKKQRHPHQQEVADMIEKALRGIEANIEARLVPLREEYDAAGQAKSGLEATHSKVEESCLAKLQEVEAAHAAKKDRESASAAAEAALGAARSAQAEAVAAQERAVEQKARLQAAAESVKGEDSEQGVSQVQKLVDLGKDLLFDESLLNGMRVAMERAPASRGPFDNMVISKFEEELQKQITAADATLAGGEASEHATAVQAAEAELEAVHAREQEAAAALATAEAQGEDLRTEARAAKKAVQDCNPALRQTKAALTRVEAELERFRATTLLKLEPEGENALAAPVEAAEQAAGGPC